VFNLDKIEDGWEYARLVLIAAEEGNYFDEQAKAHNQIGIIHNMLGNLQEAMAHYFKSVELFS